MRIVCGLQPVREALRAHGDRLARVVIAAGHAPSPQLEALARFARDQGVAVERRERTEIDHMAKGVRHQGAIALAPELRIWPLARLDTGDKTLVVALDEVQDPQNFGAVVRCAVAFGAHAVVWPEHRSAPLSAATFRASAGAIEHAALYRVGSLPAALADLRARGVRIVGLDMAGARAIDRVELTGPVAFVAGAEGKGLRKPVKGACDEVARLPMPGPIGSLNVSVAVAVALYEAVRQRSAP